MPIVKQPRAVINTLKDYFNHTGPYLRQYIIRPERCVMRKALLDPAFMNRMGINPQTRLTREDLDAVAAEIRHELFEAYIYDERAFRQLSSPQSGIFAGYNPELFTDAEWYNARIAGGKPGITEPSTLRQLSYKFGITTPETARLLTDAEQKILTLDLSDRSSLKPQGRRDAYQAT